MLTVGEELRRKREEKGLSIKDVVDGTYIQAKFIIALECNDYSVFPAEVYTKGFLKNYAELLGLDSQQILELFKNTKDKVEPVYDQEYYKTAANLEPDMQKVSDLEDRKISIQQAIAADDDLNAEVVKIIRVEHEANEEHVAIELESVEIVEPTEEKSEACLEELELETNESIPETVLEAQEIQAPVLETVSVEELVEEARQEPTAFTEEQTVADHVQLVKRKQEPIEQEDEDVIEQQPESEAKTTVTAANSQQSSFKQKLVENRNNGKSKTKTILTVVFLLVALASAYFMLTGKDSSSTDNSGQKSSSINLFKPAASEKPVQVQIIELTGNVNARCWVSIVADGKTIFEDNLQPGTTFKWPAKESLKVTIGNVSALADLKLNGKPADLGQVRNNVVEKTFSLKDVK